MTYEGDDCRVVSQRCMPGRQLLPGAERRVGLTVAEILGETQGQEFCAAMRRAVATKIVQIVTVSFNGQRFQCFLTPNRQSFIRRLTAGRAQPARRSTAKA